MKTIDLSIGEGEAHLALKAIEFGRKIERGELPEPKPDKWLVDVIAFAFPQNET